MAEESRTLTSEPMLIHGKQFYPYYWAKPQPDELIDSNYFSEKRSLQEVYTPEELSTGLVVAAQTTILKNKRGDPVYKFTYFKRHIEFLSWLLKHSEPQRVYFEVLQDQPRKFCLDIDISLKEHQTYFSRDYANSLVSLLVQRYNASFGPIDLERDVAITDSSDATKISVHIIFTNAMYQKTEDLVLIYNQLTNDLSAAEKRIVDPSIYKSLQYFRLLFNQKLNSGRIKKFQEHWHFQGSTIHHKYQITPDSEAHRMQMQMLETMIGFKHRDIPIKTLHSYKPTPTKLKTSGVSLDQGELSRLEEMLSVLPYKDQFTIGSIIDPGPHILQMRLERVRSGECPICKRVHTSDGYLLTVMKKGEVKFGCWREREERRAKKEELGTRWKNSDITIGWIKV